MEDEDVQHGYLFVDRSRSPTDSMHVACQLMVNITGWILSALGIWSIS